MVATVLVVVNVYVFMTIEQKTITTTMMMKIVLRRKQ